MVSAAVGVTIVAAPAVWGQPAEVGWILVVVGVSAGYVGVRIAVASSYVRADEDGVRTLKGHSPEWFVPWSAVGAVEVEYIASERGDYRYPCLVMTDGERKNLLMLTSGAERSGWTSRAFGSAPPYDRGFDQKVALLRRGLTTYRERTSS